MALTHFLQSFKRNLRIQCLFCKSLACLIHEFNFEKFSGVSCEAVANYREQLIT